MVARELELGPRASPATTMLTRPPRPDRRPVVPPNPTAYLELLSSGDWLEGESPAGPALAWVGLVLKGFRAVLMAHTDERAIDCTQNWNPESFAAFVEAGAKTNAFYGAERNLLEIIAFIVFGIPPASNDVYGEPNLANAAALLNSLDRVAGCQATLQDFCNDMAPLVGSVPSEGGDRVLALLDGVRKVDDIARDEYGLPLNPR